MNFVLFFFVHAIDSAENETKHLPTFFCRSIALWFGFWIPGVGDNVHYIPLPLQPKRTLRSNRSAPAFKKRSNDSEIIFKFHF